MATVTTDAVAPGKAGVSPLFGSSVRPIKIATGTFDFDSSYPTGGEDITDIYNMFSTCLGVNFVGDGTRLYPVDHTNKKVKSFTALGTESTNAANLSAVTGIRWFAWGYL